MVIKLEYEIDGILLWAVNHQKRFTISKPLFEEICRKFYVMGTNKGDFKEELLKIEAELVFKCMKTNVFKVRKNG